MLVKYGGGILGASGSIGGQTHARNRFGNYVRARTKPVNPNTARQQSVRSALIAIVARWGQNLTAAQRSQWDTYAANIAWQNKLGETVKLTGFNMYVRSNTALAAAGIVPQDDGPAILALPGGDNTLAVTASETTQLLSVSFDDTFEWLDEDDGALIVSMGLPQSATREFFNGPWRIAGTVAGSSTVPPTTPQTFAGPYAFQETQLVYIRARIIRADGRVSQFFRTSGVAAA